MREMPEGKPCVRQQSDARGSRRLGTLICIRTQPINSRFSCNAATFLKKLNNLRIAFTVPVRIEKQGKMTQ